MIIPISSFIILSVFACSHPNLTALISFVTYVTYFLLTSLFLLKMNWIHAGKCSVLDNIYLAENSTIPDKEGVGHRPEVIVTAHLHLEIAQKSKL